MTSIGNTAIFAKNLSYYIERSGKTQKEIALALNVATSTFNNWVKGNKYPRMDKVEMLANYFGILKSDLIEEKLTEEKKKDNDLMADVVVRMRMDEDFRNFVFISMSVDSEKLKNVAQLLSAFDK